MCLLYLYTFMAKCRYCGSQISRLDKEICPFCGGRKPLEGTDTSTIDITKAFDPATLEKEGLKRKSKGAAVILAVCFGWMGANFFYLGYWKKGLIQILASILLMSIGFLLYGLVIDSIWCILVPSIDIFLGNIFCAYRYLTRHDITDARGEFLK